MNKQLALYAPRCSESLGVSYADARLIKTTSEVVETRDLFVVYAGENENIGLGIRVMVRGGWGFAGSSSPHPSGRCLCRHQGGRGSQSQLTSSERTREAGAGKAAPGCLAVALQHRPVQNLHQRQGQLASRMREADAQDARREADLGLLTFTREKKLFVSTEGSDIVQTFLTSGCGIDAQAGVDEHFVRS